MAVKVIVAAKPLVMMFLVLIAYVDASPMRGNVVSNQVEPDCGPSAALKAHGVTIGRELSTEDDRVDGTDPDCGPSSAILTNGNKDLEAVDTMVANGERTNTTVPDCGPTSALVVGSKSDSSKATNGEDDKKSIPSSDNNDMEAIDTESSVVANGDRNGTTEPECGPTAALVASSISDSLKATNAYDKKFIQSNDNPEAVNIESNMVANGDRINTTEPDCGPTASLVASSKIDSSKSTNGDDKKSVQSTNDKDQEAILSEDNMVANGDDTNPDCGPTASLIASSKGNPSKATNGDNKKSSMLG